jgi:hypothetical protein
MICKAYLKIKQRTNEYLYCLHINIVYIKLFTANYNLFCKL